MAIPRELDAVIGELGEFFSPVEVALSSPPELLRFLREFGYDPSVNLGTLVASLADPAAAASNLTAVLDRRADGTELGPDDYAAVIEQAARVFLGIRQIPSLAAGVNIAGTFFAEVFDYLFAKYLFFRVPPVYHFSHFVGVLTVRRVVPGEDPDARQVAYEKYEFRWDRLRQLLTDSGALARDVYGWGTDRFDSDLMLLRVAQFFNSCGLLANPVRLTSELTSRLLPAVPVDSAFGLRIPLYEHATDLVEGEAGVFALPVTGATASDGGIGLMPYAVGALDAVIPVTPDGTRELSVRVNGNVAGGAVITLRPSGLGYEADIFGASGDVSATVDLRIKPPAGQPRILVFGSADSTRFEITGAHVGLGGGRGDLFIAGGVKGLRLAIDVSQDGLLSQIIPEPIIVDAGDIVVGWRLGRGIYFEQGAGITIRIPLNVDLTVMRIHQLAIGVEFAPDTAIVFSVNADATLGPLFLGVEGLGIRMVVVPNDDGMFGTFDLVPGVQFPTGYAAALNGGPIQGGGALFAYESEYRGALALKFQSFGLSAFAILSTKLPDGTDGFSFLASLFGEFEIQLGYGFKLTGLGGIIGINRTANVAELRAVLASGRLDGILFPANPIQDAAVLLNDMASIFPAREGQHLFGPMAKIAWGTPTLIEGKLGVILEIGADVRVLILGSLTSSLPVKEAAIVVLNLDFVGTIEFSTGAIAFDATLANSRILSWPVSGEAAVRTGWGQSAGLVASVGGFHPTYPRPAGFPDLQRLTIAFGTNNPSLTLTAYLAVTLNTVQAGAAATLYAKGPDIWLVGQVEVEGWAAFNALIHFEPFQFDASLDLGLKLLIDGDTICGIGGDLRLRGPNTYHIRGKVWVTVMGVDISVKIKHTWGDEREEIPQRVDPLEILRAAVASAAGFEPIETTSRVSGVTFKSRPAGAADEPVVDPSGGLRFVQRALPLGVPITRVGTAKRVGSFDTFDLAFRAPGGGTVGTGPAFLEFARGHFFDLSDDERLRGPATESYRAGVDLEAQDALVFDPALRLYEPEYETIFLGDEEDARDLGVQPFDRALTAQWLQATGRAVRPLHGDFVEPALTARALRVEDTRFVAPTDTMTADGARARTVGAEVLQGSAQGVAAATGGARVVARYLTADRRRTGR